MWSHLAILVHIHAQCQCRPAGDAARHASVFSGREETRVIADARTERPFETDRFAGLAVVEIRSDRPLLEAPYNERDARMSPDGRWIAYVSDESGRPEVSVRSVVGPRQRDVMSAGGGDQPVWRGDGSEPFFVDLQGRLSAVSVRPAAGGVLSFRTPVPLKVPPIGPGHLGTQYDVTRDGSFSETPRSSRHPTFGPRWKSPTSLAAGAPRPISYRRLPAFGCCASSSTARSERKNGWPRSGMNYSTFGRSLRRLMSSARLRCGDCSREWAIRRAQAATTTRPARRNPLNVRFDPSWRGIDDPSRRGSPEVHQAH